MPARASTASVAHRLGGRWALSLASFVVVAFGILASIFVGEESATRSVGEAAQWLVVCCVGILVYGLLLLIFDRWTPYRDRRTTPIPLPTLVIGTIVIGTAIALSLGLTAEWLGLESVQTLPLRVAGVVLIGSWFGWGLTLLLDEIDRSRQARTRLIERQVSVELASLQQTLLIEELRNEVQGEVDARLREAQEDLARRLHELTTTSDGVTSTDTSMALRTLAEETVRPLSTQLWSTAARQYPRIKWSRVLINTIRHEPLRPVVLAVIHVVGTALQTINRFGTTSGLLMLVMTVFAIFIVCLPANALMQRYPAWHGRIFVVAVVILEAQIVPAVLWRESLAPGSATVAWAATQVVAGVLIILLTSGFGSWRQQRRATERSYLEDLDQELVSTLARSRAVAELARELSRTLHGTVQSKIVACAMVSEQAIESGNVEQLKAALEQAQRVLASSRMGEKAPIGAVTEVRRKVALWDQLCAIDVHIDEGIDDGTGSGERVGRVVEEGLANAIRHGGATAISVTLTSVDGGICIVIDDDGGGPPATPVPGLGSTVLDQATGGRWSLTALPRGARLEAIVSPRPADGVV